MFKGVKQFMALLEKKFKSSGENASFKFLVCKSISWNWLSAES